MSVPYYRKIAQSHTEREHRRRARFLTHFIGPTKYSSQTSQLTRIASRFGVHSGRQDQIRGGDDEAVVENERIHGVVERTHFTQKIDDPEKAEHCISLESSNCCSRPHRQWTCIVVNVENCPAFVVVNFSDHLIQRYGLGLLSAGGLTMNV